VIPPDKIRILLADDHTLVRAGIRSLLEKMPAVEVVAEAADGRTALELIRKHSPSLVLMDIAMRELNGLQATERIARQFPTVRVIILSMHANEEYVLQALRSGAAGYLLKDAATVELELAIKAVMRGETYLSPAISKSVIEQYLARLKGGETPAANLTLRQREILQLIAEGTNTKEIASMLGISVKTVETHRSQVMNRLGIHDVAGLVRYAIRTGLVSPER
jgi:DNA-binding NarL/FixJ family response regulator